MENALEKDNQATEMRRISMQQGRQQKKNAHTSDHLVWYFSYETFAILTNLRFKRKHNTKVGSIPARCPKVEVYCKHCTACTLD